MNEDVDAPITDIAFLTSTENCPSGYRVVRPGRREGEGRENLPRGTRSAN